jgi:DNA-binding response OmpR family regulator
MGRKIMVVDDDKDFLEELAEVLSLGGFEVVGVNDPMQAIEKAHTTKPDLILLDLKMPGKSGFQLADEFKHSQEFTHLPVLAMSGFFTEGEHIMLMNICGIQKCLKKPVNTSEMIAQITAVLAKTDQCKQQANS